MTTDRRTSNTSTVAAFLAQNPEIDLRRIDLFDRAVVARLRCEGFERDELLADLRTHQRLLRIAPTPEAAAELVAAGYDSARGVALQSERRFLAENPTLFGGDREAARSAHRKAVSTKNQINHLWASIRQLVGSRHHRASPSANADRELIDYVEGIPSYQDLFGSLDYLACPRCQSIFGPAAYFVDLMRIVDEYVTYPNTHKLRGNIPDGLRLEDRRPDLFDLPLSCANTDTVVPFLQIVNEVLEAKIQRDTGGQPYEVLALAAFPFNLPFQLPLAEIRSNLRALQTTLADVYATYAAPLAAGAVAGASITTVTLAHDASAKDGFYVGMDLAVTSGAGAGQTRRVTAYAGATRVATVVAFAAAPDAGSLYQIVDGADVARERLGLSLEQAELVMTPAATSAALSRAYGYDDIVGHVYAFQAGAGELSFSAGSTTVTGVGTSFGATVTVGDQLLCNQEIRTVSAIAGPTALTVSAPWGAAASGATYQVARWFAGAGTVTVSRQERTVTGSGVAESVRAPGDQIQIAGVVRTVVEIESDTELLVDTAWGIDAAAAPYTVNPVGVLDRVATFLERTGLDQKRLIALLDQQMSPREITDGSANQLYINDTGEGLPPLQLVTDTLDPAFPYLRLVGLSQARLDRLQRFIRLAAWASWPYASLDWLLVTAGDEGITSEALTLLALTAELTAATKLDPDVVASWWYPLKTIGHVDDRDRKDLFDRIYNNPALLQGRDPYTNPVPIPFDPARPLPWRIEERTAGGESASIRSRLLGALAISDDELTRAGHFVAALTGASGGVLSLDLDNLSWLYRLVSQARAAKLSISDFLTLLRLLDFPASSLPPVGAVPATPAAASRNQAAARWIAASPFDVPTLLYVLTGETSPGYKRGYGDADLRKLINDAAVASKDTRVGPGSFVLGTLGPAHAEASFDALVREGYSSEIGIVLDRVLSYDTLAFTVPVSELSFVTQDISAAESIATFDSLDQNGVLLVAGNARIGTLSASFDASTDLSYLFRGDPNAAAKQAEVRRILLDVQSDIHAVVRVMTDARAAQEANAQQAVIGFLQVSQASLSPMLDFTFGVVTLGACRAGLLTPLLDPEPIPSEVVSLIDGLARTALWVDGLGYTGREIAAVALDPKPFAIADTTALAFDDLVTLSGYKTLTTAFDDRSDLLLAYFAAPAGERDALLSEITGWPVDQIAYLNAAFWPPAAGPPPRGGPATVTGVTRLQRAFALAGDTGTDAFFLRDLTGLLHRSVGPVSGTLDRLAWSEYERQAARTLDAVAGRMGPTEFAAAHAQITDAVEAAQRNALLGYTIWSLNRTFPFLRTPADLYQFLLLDVEMGSCARTSKIAQAISSVQLYLQRARMNLEPGVTELDVDPVWWEWLSGYRLWEANRLIFVYPENYLSPGLRSGQTPQFEALRQQLAQSNLGDASVADAFSNYFAELSQLASLRVTGAHRTTVHRASGDRDVLYFVARAATDPYSYFYRSHDLYDGWSPWWKIDLSINSAFATPVVAFDRLFLFWADLATVKTANVNPQDSTTTERYFVDATVRYSFLGVGERWVQPQALGQPFPIAVGPDDYTPLGNATVAKALDTSNLAWKQPYPLRIARGLPGTGRVVVTAGQQSVKGTGTVFTKELRPGDTIYCGAERRAVVEVRSNLEAVVASPWSVTSTDAEFKVIPGDPQTDGFPPFTGAGTASVTAGLSNVTGKDGSAFTTEVSVGDRLLIGSELRNVTFVASATSLLVDRPWTKTTSGSYTIVPLPTGAEKLVVLFGGPLATTSNISYSAPIEAPNPGRDTFLAQKAKYDDAVYYALQLAKQIRATHTTPGFVTISSSATVDAELNLVAPRFALLDYPYGAKDAPRPFRGIVSRTEQILRVAQSDNAIFDNDWGNSAPGTTDTLPATGLVHDLLFNVSGRHAVLLAVDNRVGEMVFDNGDETFWVRALHPDFEQIAEMTYLRQIDSAETGREAYQLSAGPYTRTKVDFATLDFEFIRTSTSTIGRLRQRLLAGGIPELLTVSSQRTPELRFSRFYPIPTQKPDRVIPPATDTLDFDGAYGLYFQEIFLFIPWLVATRLTSQLRFEEAKHWLEYVFDPTALPELGDLSSADRYWRYLPFRDLTIERLSTVLQDPVQIAAYNDHPFDPDAIARLRPGAYAEAIVLAYVKNLLGWADSLFARDTLESIDQATQLYVMASELLGPRPQVVGECLPRTPITFREIRAQYGQNIPQFVIDLENATPLLGAGPGRAYADVPFNDVQGYFCVPENGDLMQLWDRIEDRLYKIRHCMNLAGVARDLPLFAPPINPMDLVRSGGTGQGGLPRGVASSAPIPYYRFTVLVEKAREVAGLVMQLGGELLSAIEKRDAEALARLRSGQELALLDLTTMIKQQQVVEADETGQALTESLAAATLRREHYEGLLVAGLSAEEIDNLKAMEASLVFNVLASVATTAASIGYAIPQVGSPFAMTYGGAQIGASVQAAAGVFQIGSIISSYIAQKALTVAGYQRRDQEWSLQARLAALDEKQIADQIAANDARQAIARRDLEIHQQAIAQSQALQDFLTRKFTSKELYDWMVGRIAEVYFQSYLMAFDLARSAQRAYQFERGTNQTFLDFGYWDSLRRGLLAGEGLMQSLTQMEKAYLDGNRRPLEIRRTISLLQLDPKALLTLKATGSCTFAFSEALFDFDFPGHYRRQIASLSVSIPAVVGPYQSIKATLTQLGSQVLLVPSVEGVRYLLGESTAAPGPDVLRSNWWANQEIALSRGSQDSGVFEPAGGDPRYLPFEATGAVSSWKLSLPKATNHFDFASIGDVLFEIGYTALDGGKAFREAVVAQEALREYAGSPLLDFRQQYPQAWFAFMRDHEDPLEQTLSFKVNPAIVLPHLEHVELVGFLFVLRARQDGASRSAAAGDEKPYIRFSVTAGKDVDFALGPNDSYQETFSSPIDMSEVLAGERKITFLLPDTPSWLKAGGYLDPAVVEDIGLVLYYRGRIRWSSR